MKRKEQIQDAAADHRDAVCCGFYDPVADARQDSFVCGAEWADEHPKPGMINKQKFIEKAREWLSDNKDNYIIIICICVINDLTIRLSSDYCGEFSVISYCKGKGSCLSRSLD